MKNKEEPIREICLVVGFFSLIAGLWLIYPPAMFIIGGFILMWIGLPPRKGGSS